MPFVKNVERRIREIEGFNVIIRGDDGHDVRADRQGIRQYDYTRGAKNVMTVQAWKLIRFQPSYPGFRVDVLDNGGHSVAGNTKLGTVRHQYL